MVAEVIREDDRVVTLGCGRSLRPPEVEQRQAVDQLHRTSGTLQKSFNSADYLSQVSSTCRS
ncbi:MAG: hypothetical protein M3R63_06640, partial [Actinomycetota bacterium]|nr:hypothetical protein [Actinomycetota bacterium]